MKILTYSLLSVLISLLMFALLPLILVAWLMWRAHKRKVLTLVPHARYVNEWIDDLERVLCDSGQPGAR
jgi:uncharacterized iron-regulated membrane protein